MAQDKQERAYMAKAGAKALAKPKKTAEPFVMLPAEVLNSIAYEALGYSARAMLIEMVHFYYGGNNGKVWITPEMLKKRGFSKNTATKAFRELSTTGFIYMTRRGGSKLGLCSWYALTWLPIDKSEGMYLDGFIAKKFLKYIPEEKKSRSEIGIGSPKNWDSAKKDSSKGNTKKSFGKSRAPKNCDDSIPNSQTYKDLCQSISKEESQASKTANTRNWIAQDQARLKEIGLAGCECYQAPTKIH